MVNMSNRDKAILWMRKNPHVVAMFQKFGEQMAERNRRFSFSLLCERVRWECTYEYDQDDYKINNNFYPYIGRYLVHKNPTWKALVRFKTAQGETRGVVDWITDAELTPPLAAAA
jgi:hypothetical protein